MAHHLFDNRGGLDMKSNNPKKEAVITASLLGATIGMILSAMLLASGFINLESNAGLIALFVAACMLPGAFIGKQFGEKYWREFQIEPEKQAIPVKRRMPVKRAAQSKQIVRNKKQSVDSKRFIA
ncbi:MAG: hypothetical protein OQK04_15115 [Kangiellaceae bacterium]|nr:hypothetical protein [Kangiellaceae bacterium]MCW9000039.1 hypothetical protein [Kangiellaceae bacterium]